ncbi:FGGY-family carbohydrate kinase, partial [Salmonella enterica subsp. enterica serovar Anatum]|nr:FGGY-family carbohydrate kinase [Salmonella enterica subsp. enterica serovar Anatum]
GLTHQHGPAELARAVLEGVGYALADGMDVVHACGVKPASVTLPKAHGAMFSGLRRCPSCWVVAENQYNFCFSLRRSSSLISAV